jgi:uncharacterized protein YbjQ (UPF0145 family)
MPFFHCESDEERARRRAREAEQAASIEALERGGLPLQAQRRLQELARDQRRLFTSDLSVDEFVLATSAGFRPITQVMGSAFYHVGWILSRRPYATYYSGELEVLTEAYNNARQLALGRMRQEAQLVGASAVIGVEITFRAYDWAEDIIEYTAVGTAVHIVDAPPAPEPALTNLSGQDFWKLLHAGYWPVGLVAGNCVYYVAASWNTQQLGSFWGTGWWNQEIPEFTQGLSTARDIAQDNMVTEAFQLGAEGIVGVSIQQQGKEYEIELPNDQQRTDMIFTFMAMGTAIVPLAHPRPQPTVQAVLELDV